VSARFDPCVFVQNDFGRRDVPVLRSFEAWVRAALTGRHCGRAEVNIALFDIEPARDFNLRYRGKDYATNVLSFPYEPAPHEKSALLGDLVLCPPVIAREAADQGKRVRDHYAHLTVHGVLHLLGHDHESEKDARKMEALERRILAGLGIVDPYN
jgi:probable rRNA maturation factor